MLNPTASDGAPFDFFGFSVAISGDTAVVGARLGDSDVSRDTGSAYVYDLMTCTAFDIDLNLIGLFFSGLEVRQACNTITASSVVVMNGGDLTLQAATVELLNGFTVEAGGALTISNAIPR